LSAAERKTGRQAAGIQDQTIFGQGGEEALAGKPEKATVAETSGQGVSAGFLFWRMPPFHVEKLRRNARY
jgi:hypothetical protein